MELVKKLSMRILYFILIVYILTACDEKVEYDFFVKNNCSETIEVDIVDYKNTSIRRSIPATEELLVYNSGGYNKLVEEKVESVFKYIIVTKGIDTAKRNYVDRSEWQMQATSDTHANFYLTVDSSHFVLK